ncbi:bifunctional apoptosis regulator [Labeo rohita]|uniref:Bifunctional apoptosis regulator n=1 Tax=Labeo rohita TaxID=84645 RepID=A0A498NW26_LABRO|nr:bifunctional apoptosis regulator [Labeo rohita]RXN35948.1 bifunctional apoptosis regulator [Labeo rohita]
MARFLIPGQSEMDVRIPVDEELSESEEEPVTGLSASEFTCHCCYQVLVDPTTLTCGHSFCRHCLANWWASALPRVRTDCPECRAVWTDFPKVNILLRTSSSHEVLLSKPLSRWNTDDVTLWVEHLSVWTSQYKETFRREQINGRLLFALSDEDLSAAPFSISSESHRRIILEELHRLKQRRVAPNLWQYKELNLGKTLFLQLSLHRFPRLTLLYLFLFDYGDMFLPFIHTSCPAQTTQDSLIDTPLDRPSWSQWAEFLLMYFLLPYQLLSAFAWHLLSVHYWTARVVMLHAVFLSVLDVHFFWTLLKRGEIRTLPKRVWQEVLAVMMKESLFVLLWPLIPLFFCNFIFYYNLYVCPFYTAALVKRTLLQTDTQQQRI